MKRILIVGSGFAGFWSALSAVRLLDQQGETENVEVALVAPQPELHVRPRLYETGADGMRAPLMDLFDAVGVRFIRGKVATIRPDAQEVTVVSDDGEETTVGYDRLVLAAGSRLYRPDIPGLQEHSFSVDQVDEASELEAHIKDLANQPESDARNTVVVAGGGFTGIETAAEMPARLRDALGENANVRVVIVEREGDIGPDLGPGPRPVIIKALTDLGVEWQTGAGVASVDADGITTQTGERIPASTVIWTAGARSNPLTAQVPGEKDQFGRLHVDRNLKVIGSDTIFATGDCAYAATDDDGNFAAMSCQHAMGLGRSAGHNVAASLLGVDPIPYSQPKYVTCLDLGPWGAVYTEGWDRQVAMEGAEAKALKTQINTLWIYPPNADRAEALEAADPERVIVA
ncbi:NAD(P)/FAD-dependent oxidoreductase [Aurantiacibacter rhizosphaerae]|uniref:NAD(P)/FAD-dependent oxidoreductase n=1 Tax=Aurantiacibacter rhizosphaerae TaxID=2691582 RepID=A0A844XGC1_9SPHN|nr:NAD(P)/FAD-dependent oxidoreductase [Aurantiacibacter rhizosphaerae]MWV28575.1 NAD(P)/FAD-dependent oxidoreductase [Aurantiacibacter rhizosphaerae]